MVNTIPFRPVEGRFYIRPYDATDEQILLRLAEMDLGSRYLKLSDSLHKRQFTWELRLIKEEYVRRNTFKHGVDERWADVPGLERTRPTTLTDYDLVRKWIHETYGPPSPLDATKPLESDTYMRSSLDPSKNPLLGEDGRLTRAFVETLIPVPNDRRLLTGERGVFKVFRKQEELMAQQRGKYPTAFYKTWREFQVLKNAHSQGKRGYYTDIEIPRDKPDSFTQRGIVFQRSPEIFTVYLYPQEIAEQRRYPPGRASYSAFPGTEADESDDESERLPVMPPPLPFSGGLPESVRDILDDQSVLDPHAPKEPSPDPFAFTDDDSDIAPENVPKQLPRFRQPLPPSSDTESVYELPEEPIAGRLPGREARYTGGYEEPASVSPTEWEKMGDFSESDFDQTISGVKRERMEDAGYIMDSSQDESEPLLPETLTSPTEAGDLPELPIEQLQDAIQDSASIHEESPFCPIETHDLPAAPPEGVPSLPVIREPKETEQTGKSVAGAVIFAAFLLTWASLN